MDLNTKMYQTFRGVDYSASPAVISDDHAADMLNMYVGEDGVMQKRPGWHVLKDFGAPINGIHYMQYPSGYMNMFVHAGTKLYVVDFRPAWRNFQYPEYGDIEIAGSEIILTSSSANYINRYVGGQQSALPWQVKNMDVNFDGVVDKRDAEMILKYVVGYDLGLPAGHYGMLPTDYTVIKYGNNTAFDLANVKSLMFDHEDKLYIADGVNYYCIEPVYGSQNEIQKFKASVVSGYIPTTGIAGYYKYDELNEEGTNTPGSQENPGVWQPPQLYEKRNLLTSREINTFIADGIHKAYYLRCGCPGCCCRCCLLALASAFAFLLFLVFLTEKLAKESHIYSSFLRGVGPSALTVSTKSTTVFWNFSPSDAETHSSLSLLGSNPYCSRTILRSAILLLAL